VAGPAAYRDEAPPGLRALIYLRVTQSFFDEPSANMPAVIHAIKGAFDDLGGRFGVRVLGTFDDDELMVGTPPAPLPTACILIEVPSLEAAAAICNIARVTEVGGARLWKYLRVEARIGRALFFGNS
jgi:hypothetical protein